MNSGQTISVIADSSSTRTQWALVQQGIVLEQAVTSGINPYFMNRREISHHIRLELPEVFFRRRWRHIYFYGAGCTGADKSRVVEASLVAQFKTPVTVMSDLLGAARGLLVHESGLACILGTGSNSCYYDGERIVQHVRPLGFILGDEGSGAALGKRLVSDVLKGLAPKELSDAFFDQYQLTPDEVLDAVLNNPAAHRNLREFSSLLAEHIHNDYVHHLVASEFRRFFDRNISQYAYHQHAVSFVGAIATTYSDILLEVANEFGATVSKIVLDSMPGLVTYHSDQ